MLLNDFERIESARGITFIPNTLEAVNIDSLIVGELVEQAIEYNKNARICLHLSPEDQFHSMIICELEGNYFPPHIHKKAESICVLQGLIMVFIFHESGELIDKYLLQGNFQAIIHLPANTWHMIIPLSKFVVYHETKLGPFLGESDRKFAPWAPGLGEDSSAFLKGLGL